MRSCGLKHTIIDLYGNRASVMATGQAADGSPIPMDGLTAVTYDALTNHVTTQGFAYDKAGNQTGVVRADRSSLRFQYDAAGHLAIVFDGNDKVLEQYAYGADGHRLLKSGGDGSIDPTRYYFWDGDKVIAEYTKPSSTGVMEIRNKQDFATLAWIRGEWELKVSGKRVANGKLPALKTAPQKEEKINRPKSIAWQPRRCKARFSM